MFGLGPIELIIVFIIIMPFIVGIPLCALYFLYRILRSVERQADTKENNKSNR